MNTIDPNDLPQVLDFDDEPLKGADTLPEEHGFFGKEDETDRKTEIVSVRKPGSMRVVALTAVAVLAAIGIIYGVASCQSGAAKLVSGHAAASVAHATSAKKTAPAATAKTAVQKPAAKPAAKAPALNCKAPTTTAEWYTCADRAYTALRTKQKQLEHEQASLHSTIRDLVIVCVFLLLALIISCIFVGFYRRRANSKADASNQPPGHLEDLNGQ